MTKPRAAAARPRPKITTEQADLLWRVADAVNAYDHQRRDMSIGRCTAQTVLATLLCGMEQAVNRPGCWEREAFELLLGGAIDLVEKSAEYLAEDRRIREASRRDHPAG